MTKPARGHDLVAFALAVTLVGWAGDASAAGYLRVSGIEGEVTAAGFENQIQVDSLSGGFANAVDPGPPVTSSGRPVFSPVVVTKGLDKSSPLLWQALCSGQAIPEVEFTLVETGERLTPVLQILLGDARVSSIETSGSSGETPAETVEFIFDRIQWKILDRAGGQQIFGWDLLTGAPR